MTIPGHPDASPHPVDAVPIPVLSEEPLDERGEQWHGVHSNADEPREPRRQPGGVQRSIAGDGAGFPIPG